jgi:protein phosphatase 1 regulatory subunit 7
LSSPLPDGIFEGLGNLEELDLYDNRLGPVVEDEELRGLGNLTSATQNTAYKSADM